MFIINEDKRAEGFSTLSFSCVFLSAFLTRELGAQQVAFLHCVFLSVFHCVLCVFSVFPLCFVTGIIIK